MLAQIVPVEPFDHRGELGGGSVQVARPECADPPEVATLQLESGVGAQSGCGDQTVRGLSGVIEFVVTQPVHHE